MAASIVTLAVVGGTIGLLLPSPSAPATDPPGVVSSSAEEPARADACTRSSDSRAVPEDLRWEARNGLAWPVSDSTGPSRSEQGFDACFERSPVGAALAATSFVYARADHSAVETYQFWVIDSAGKAAGMAKAVESDARGTFAEQQAKAPMTPAGFRVEDYTPDRAVVRLIFDTSAGKVGIPAVLEWSDGDWRVKVDDFGGVPEGGAFSGEYTRWRTDG